MYIVEKTRKLIPKKGIQYQAIEMWFLFTISIFLLSYPFCSVIHYTSTWDISHSFVLGARWILNLITFFLPLYGLSYFFSVLTQNFHHLSLGAKSQLGLDSGRLSVFLGHNWALYLHPGVKVLDGNLRTGAHITGDTGPFSQRHLVHGDTPIYFLINMSSI